MSGYMPDRMSEQRKKVRWMSGRMPEQMKCDRIPDGTSDGMPNRMSEYYIYMFR